MGFEGLNEEGLELVGALKDFQRCDPGLIQGFYQGTQMVAPMFDLDMPVGQQGGLPTRALHTGHDHLGRGLGDDFSRGLALSLEPIDAILHQNFAQGDDGDLIADAFDIA